MPGEPERTKVDRSESEPEPGHQQGNRETPQPTKDFSDIEAILKKHGI